MRGRGSPLLNFSLPTFPSHRDTSSPRPAINPTTCRWIVPLTPGTGKLWKKPYLEGAGRPWPQQPAVAGLHRAAPVLAELLRAGPALARRPQHHGAPTHHLAWDRQHTAQQRSSQRETETKKEKILYFITVPSSFPGAKICLKKAINWEGCLDNGDAIAKSKKCSR